MVTVGELVNGLKLLLKLPCFQGQSGTLPKSGGQFANSIRTFMRSTIKGGYHELI